MPPRFDPDRHRRRSLRLAGMDYRRAGAYFVTLCAANRACLFGEVVAAEMRLNEAGRIVGEEWAASAELRGEVELDAFVVMPNHLHAVVWLRESDPPRPAGPHLGTAPVGPRPRSLGALVGGFKATVTRRIHALQGAPGGSVWQRNYFEHVIRDEAALLKIREYIAANPARWAADPENPAARTEARSRGGG